MRHLNNVKRFEGGISDHDAVLNNGDNNDRKQAFKLISTDGHEHYDNSKNYYSIGLIKLNSRYYNNDFVT